MTITPTRTDVCSISLARTPDGRARVTSGGGPFRVITLAVSGDSARVALVPDRALLLAGDSVAMSITVADGLALHVQETSGTVAYDMRGDSASWACSASVGVGAGLVLDSLPWVSAKGSRVDRSLTVDLAESGTLLARETLVLGRSGEGPGSLVARMSVTRGGRPVIVEELRSAHLSPYRILDSVLAVGHGAQVDSRPMLLDSGDRLWRRLGRDAHVTAADLDPVWGALV
jgi:urease accessory protein